MPEQNMQSFLAHGGRAANPDNAPASLPVSLSSGWEFTSTAQAEAVFSGALPGTGYGNGNTPNHEALERVVTELEGTEAAVITAGGMGAIATAFFGLLAPGDHVIAGKDLFGV